MTVYIDDVIYKLQSSGGISTLWKKLTPHLEAALKEVTWGEQASDYFLSTYYASSPDGLKSIAIIYDFIAEHYRPIGSQAPDAIQKRRAISASSAVIAISGWVAQDARALTDKPVTVAHCGTDMVRATPEAVEAFREKYGLYTSYVLVVGRRHLYKNVSALYQAWQYWQGREYHTVLCVGGEAPEMPDQQFARAFAGQWAQVRLLDNEMSAAYTGASMLVYPSLYEGFGLPVLEAMACGTPVVCAKRGAIPEFALDTPYYADVFRPLSLASQMDNALIADVERQLNAMRIAKTYTWQRMADTIVNTIKDLSTNDLA